MSTDLRQDDPSWLHFSANGTVPLVSIPQIFMECLLSTSMYRLCGV